MANWAYINNGIIEETHDILPKNWRNVSNLDVLEISEGGIETLQNLGWYPVQHNTVDYNPSTQKLKSMSIEFDGRIVYEVYEAENIPSEILYNEFITELRITRNKLLQETDYTCLYDIINVKGPQWASDWSNYRQQLRDLPNLYNDMNANYDIRNVNWPVKPGQPTSIDNKGTI